MPSAVSDAWRVASINSFEQVPVATSIGLLRVSAQSAFRSRPDDLRPTLVADDGDTVSRFAAIPAPPDSGGILRAAFSVPVDLATPETVFSLEFEDGFVIALPDPTPGAARINRRVTAAPVAPTNTTAPAAADEPTASTLAAPAEPPAAPESSEPPEGEERRSELQPKITELTEELAETRRQVAELRDDSDFGARARDTILGMLSAAALAGAELQATRDLGVHLASVATVDDGASAEFERRLAEAEQRYADAEAEHAETRGRLAEADAEHAETRGRLDAAEAEHAQTRGRLDEAEQHLGEATRRADSAARELAAERERVRSLEDRAVTLESEAREHLDRLTVAERERDEADEARRQAEAAVEPLMAARVRAERELAEMQDQVHKMGMERDELSRQAQAFDGVAIKARERLAEAESEHQKARGRLNELEVWTGELERRLADATTQLSESHAAAQADGAELRRLREELGHPQPPDPGAREPAPTPVQAAPARPAGPGGEDAAPGPESAAARAVRAMGHASRTVSDSQLDDIRSAALSEARAQAKHDLEDASPSRRS
jgi:predicted  nucleic acid-binding Zn-ribbon protein